MRPDNVDDIYPLSSLQLGMLFHTVADPGSGVYVQQLVLTLNGTIDASSLRRAWSLLSERHAVLRTAFLWDGLDEPVQVVRQSVEISWAEEDWSDLSPEVAADRLEEVLLKDRGRGFVLSRAPLLHLRLVRRSPDQHLLFWSFHHILLDGWSKEILLRDLAELYAAVRSDRPARLPGTRPFRDYIAYLHRIDVDSSRPFWSALLGDLHEPTPLGFDRRTTDTAGKGIRMTETYLPGDLTEAISAFARSRRVTVNTIVHCAWAELLGRYSGQDDVVYGATVTNRPAELDGIEHTAGVFINTLPVRIRIDAGKRIDDWVREVQDLLVEVRSHSTTPLIEAKRCSGVPMDRPLFESLLVFENYPVETSGASTSDLDIADVRYVEQSNYPLVLLVVPGDRLRIISVYDSSRFEDDAVDHLLHHMTHTLESIVSEASVFVKDISLPSSAWSLAVGSGTDCASARGLADLVHDQILRIAEVHPESVAVACGDVELTYRELDVLSGQLARSIVDRGVGVGDSVGLLLDRSAQMIVAVLAVLRAGAAYVPISPDSPPKRIEFVLKDSEARIVVTETQKGLLLNGEVDTLLIDELASRPGTAPNRVIPSSETAYVLYTSGSTGNPKGVVVTHANLSYSTYARFESYDSTPTSFLLLSSYTFDSSVAGIFWTLCSGGKLVIAEDRVEQDIDRLAQLIEKNQVSHTLCLPSLHRLILDFANPASLSTLRVVIVAGEACSRSVVARHFEVLPNTALFNEYGPTEGTVWTTVEKIDGTGEWVVPIGTPIANASVYVLDKRLRPVPRGAAGEIFIGGAGVAKGYLNRPDLTEHAFLSGIPGVEDGVVYRTGDLGRLRLDGRLEFLGRVDNQIKLRGHRIELDEIEHVLAAHRSVREAVVVAEGRETDADAISSTPEERIYRQLLSLGAEEATRILDEVESLVDSDTRGG